MVATLHDYTLVCPSGGQRVHVAERRTCARRSTPSAAPAASAQSALSRADGCGPAHARPRPRAVRRAATCVASLAPRWSRMRRSAVPATWHGTPLMPRDIRRRLAYARHVFDAIDLLVAPSASIADEFVRLGAPAGSRCTCRTTASCRSRRAAPPAVRERAVAGSDSSARWCGTRVRTCSSRPRGSSSASFELHIHGDPTCISGLRGRPAAGGGRLARHFHAASSAIERGEVYGGLDVLVVPSLWPENSPLVIHEAFMHGVPVVGARIGGMPELVRRRQSTDCCSTRSPLSRSARACSN